jgi:molybdopterin molybdotransferase/putative molybdopterin biosynthesis protein
VAVSPAASRGPPTPPLGWGGLRPGDTGDDFDDRFDAVIPIEQAELSPEGRLTLRWQGPLEPGQNVRSRGSTIREGALLARKERQMRPFDLACLAMGGIDQIQGYRRPRGAFLPTGSELGPPGAPVGRGQTIDSNSILAHGLLTEMGAEPLCYPITPDRPADVAAALDRALEEADVVLITRLFQGARTSTPAAGGAWLRPVPTGGRRPRQAHVRRAHPSSR